MIAWWIENAVRVHRERQEIEKILDESEWLLSCSWTTDDQVRLCMDAVLLERGIEFRVRLIYPNLFPDSPPTVVPDSNKRWSEHQYGAGGALCLEWGPDNWHPEVTGAKLLESTHRLLIGEIARDIDDTAPRVPSRHATTLGQDLRNQYERLLLGPGAGQIIADLPAQPVPSTFRVFSVGSYLIAHLDTLELPEHEPWKNPDVSASVLGKGFSLKGFSLPTKQKKWPSGSVSCEKLACYLKNDGYEDLWDKETTSAFLWTHSNGDVSWILHFGNPEKDATSAVILPVEDVRPELRLPPELQALSNKRVSILGLGSVGSKIAISLARTGVRKFLLIDDDVLFPENLVRNELDWRSVGFHKVDAVADTLHQLAPDMDIIVRRWRMDGQDSTAGAADIDDQLAQCDLVIDATAAPGGFNRVAGITAHAGVPLVWMEVFGGGIGGFMARSRPGIDPDPYTMRIQTSQWMDEQDSPAPKAVADYSAEAASGAPLVASDAAVTIIAAHATELVLDTLSDSESSIYPSNVYFIGLKTEWIFKQPLEVQPLTLERGDSSPDAEEDPELISEHLSFLGSLLPTDDDQNPTSS